MLLRQGIDHAVDGTGHHLKRHGGDEQPAEKNRIARSHQCHEPVDQRGQHSEHQYMGPVASAEGAPAVADKAEYEAQD